MWIPSHGAMFSIWCWFRDMMDARVREVEILTLCIQRADKSRQDVTEEFLCGVLERAKDQCLSHL